MNKRCQLEMKSARRKEERRVKIKMKVQRGKWERTTDKTLQRMESSFFYFGLAMKCAVLGLPQASERTESEEVE